MEKFQAINLSIEDIKQIISGAIKEEIKDLTPHREKEDRKLLSRKQTSRLLGISLTTLNQWTKEGILKGYRIGNSIRYKSNEIDEALVEIRTIKYRRRNDG